MNNFSSVLYVLSGVLGPLLLLLFIDEPPCVFRDSIPWMFADDL